MKTISKKPIYNIIELFYENRNFPLHLREIARKVKLNESSVSRYLNYLFKQGVLKTRKEGNLKKFYLARENIPKLFPIYDEDKLESLPLLRKKAIREYLAELSKKPVFAIIFGSTAKNTFKKDSDVDILEIYYSKTNNKKFSKRAESLTGMRINSFQLTENQFKKELKFKKDKTIQSAINTGFPVFNNKYYWELIYNE